MRIYIYIYICACIYIYIHIHIYKNEYFSFGHRLGVNTTISASASHAESYLYCCYCPRGRKNSTGPHGAATVIGSGASIAGASIGQECGGAGAFCGPGEATFSQRVATSSKARAAQNKRSRSVLRPRGTKRRYKQSCAKSSLSAVGYVTFFPKYVLFIPPSCFAHLA